LYLRIQISRGRRISLLTHCTLKKSKSSRQHPSIQGSLGLVKYVMASNNSLSLGKNVGEETWLLSQMGDKTCMNSPKHKWAGLAARSNWRGGGASAMG